MTQYYTCYDSPIGTLTIVGCKTAITEIHFSNEGYTAAPDLVASQAPLQVAIDQLRAYFRGELREFDLALAPSGTPFQLETWRALCAIEWGTTISYGELARRIGRPNASRAVGAANGQNPIPIVIPCHRVIGANGKLTGFGGGIAVKRRLLDLELCGRLLEAKPDA